MSCVRDFFLAPPPEPPSAFAPPRARSASVAVLAPAELLAVAAGVAAADVRRDQRAASVLVCMWGSAAAVAPALPAAARLAARLGRRELPARAAGALCVVELPTDAAAAVAMAGQAAAAADVPVVLAVARREASWDPVLRTVDLLRLAAAQDADPLLVELAMEDAARLGRPVRALRLPDGPLARFAARIGLGAAAAPAPPRSAPAAAGAPAEAVRR